MAQTPETNTPRLRDDAPRILKERWLDRFERAAVDKLADALQRSEREHYAAHEVVELVAATHRAVRADLALDEAAA